MRQKYRKRYVLDLIQAMPAERQQLLLEKHKGIDRLPFAINWPPELQKAAYPNEAPLVMVRKWSSADQEEYYNKYPPHYDQIVKTHVSELLSELRKLHKVYLISVRNLRLISGCVAMNDVHATAALATYNHFHGTEISICAVRMETILGCIA